VLMKHGKAFSDGEIVKECLMIAAEDVAPQDKLSFSAISLSRNIVTDRAKDIGEELENNLQKLCKAFVSFSIALDEWTDVVDTAQLAVFIRGVTENFEIFEEFLGLTPLQATTTGEDIFYAVESIFEKFELDWAKLKSVATDGAKAMAGNIKGFRGRLNAHLKSLGLPEIPFVHCIIHCENLCAKV